MKYNKEEFENLINDILHKAGYEIDIEIWLTYKIVLKAIHLFL